MEAAFRFNPEHPTSLLYEKHGDDYKLIGVMYTAPKRLTEDQLDERVPLSVAQWHEHVNFCVAPPDRRGEGFVPHPQFGLKGSITTQEACDAAGGTFHPVVFNWMVHVYPFEKDQASIWSVTASTATEIKPDSAGAFTSCSPRGELSRPQSAQRTTLPSNAPESTITFQSSIIVRRFS